MDLMENVIMVQEVYKMAERTGNSARREAVEHKRKQGKMEQREQENEESVDVTEEEKGIPNKIGKKEILKNSIIVKHLLTSGVIFVILYFLCVFSFNFLSFSVTSSSAFPSYSSSSAVVYASAYPSANSTASMNSAYNSGSSSFSPVPSSPSACTWSKMATYVSNVVYANIASLLSSTTTTTNNNNNTNKSKGNSSNNKNSIFDKIEYYTRNLPAWVPLWSIQMPTDDIYNNNNNEKNSKKGFSSLSQSSSSLVMSTSRPLRPSLRDLDEDSATLLPILERLNNRTFFRIFKIVLDADCPFWAVEAMCHNPYGCSVCQCDESQIPTVYKMKPVEEFVDRKQLASFARWSEKDKKPRNFWEKKDENEVLSDFLNEERNVKATYVDLKLNRPSHTSYKGGKVWQQMYYENKKMGCEIENLSEEEKKQLSEEKLKECEEVHNFRRILSGMQMNIAILSAEYYQFKKHDATSMYKMNHINNNSINNKYKDGYWEYNLDYFKEKVAPFSDRIENLYFTFSVLLRAVCHLAPILQECSCETGDDMGDLSTRADLFQLLNQTFASCHPQLIDQPLFYRRSTEVLSTFANISRLLDCVECEKCKLHGKLKMTALQLALRASAYDMKITSLERNEVTALINALAYFADSIRILKLFERRLFWLRVKFFGGIFLVILSLFFFMKKRKTKKNTEISDTKKDQ